MKQPINSELSWEVMTERVYNAMHLALKGYKLLTRSDNGALLNVAKKSYSVLTNESFKSTVSDLMRITKSDLVGYQELNGGKKVIAYLETGTKKIAGFDFKKYMAIGNSHDYSSGFFLAGTSEMMRCENQFSKLYNQRQYSIPHTVTCESKIQDMIIKVEMFMEEERLMDKRMALWKDIDISQELREMMIERVLNIDLGKVESMPTKTNNKIKEILYSINQESKDIGENLLGLFQGITHYTTHVQNQKEKSFGNLTGSGYAYNNRAFFAGVAIEEGIIDHIRLDLN
jgi:hypothetical protein